MYDEIHMFKEMSRAWKELRTIKQLRVHAILAEDQGLDPDAYIRWLTTAYNIISKGSRSILASTGTCTHMHTPSPVTLTHNCIITIF